MDPFNPTLFGRYDLVDRVGEGGMSEVFKAVQTLPGGVERVLAIKRIRSLYASDPEFVEMFADEARVCMLLQHPNIVRVVDFGEIDGAWYLAMDWVEGQDLRAVTRRRVERRSPWPVPEALSVICATLSALDCAHRQTDLHHQPLGLIHRDIKPGNILISYSGETRVLDFGIAKAVSNTHQTDMGSRPGSARYMSPEQAQGQPLDGRADLWSVGVVLHELLAGRPLFRRDSRESTLEALRSEPISPPSTVRAGLPAELDEIVLKALSRDPDGRFPTARAFRAALEPLFGLGGQERAMEALGASLSDLFAEERALARERFTWGRARARAVRVGVPEVSVVLPSTPAVSPQAPPSPAPAARRPRRALVVGLLAALSLGLALWPKAPAPELPPSADRPPALPATPAELPVAAPASAPTSPTPFAPAEGRTAARPPAAPAAPKPTGPTSVPADLPSAPAAADPVAALNADPASPPDALVDPSAPGALTVQVSAGWAVVYVDGRRVARATPLVDHSIAPGVHEVRVEQPSTGRVYERQVTIAPGAKETLRFDVD